MDTRSKILTLEEATRGWTCYSVVFGSFDVLTAARVRRLREIATSDILIAVVTAIPGSLLPVRARAELAASLAIIDCVVIADDAAALVSNAVAVFDEREADTRRTTELIDYVQRRNVG